MIVRAIGPELSAPPFNVPRALSDPTLELHDGTGALIASNHNWVKTIIGGIITTDQLASIRASGYAPSDGKNLRSSQSCRPAATLRLYVV